MLTVIPAQTFDTLEHPLPLAEAVDQMDEYGSVQVTVRVPESTYLAVTGEELEELIAGSAVTGVTDSVSSHQIEAVVPGSDDLVISVCVSLVDASATGCFPVHIVEAMDRKLLPEFRI